MLVPTLDELEVEFEQALTEYSEKCAAADARPEDEGSDAAADKAATCLVGICQKIAELPAQTLRKVALKARALDWYEFSISPPTSGDPSEMLAYQLARALIDRVS